MKTSQKGFLILVVVGLAFVNFTTTFFSKNDSGINLGILKARADFNPGEIDYPGDEVLHCRCHNDGNCYGGNAISFRPECAELPGNGDCSQFNNNCDPN